MRCAARDFLSPAFGMMHRVSFAPSQGGAVSVLFVVEGSVTVRSSDQAVVSVARGEGIVVFSTAELAFTAEGASATIEIHLGAEFCEKMWEHPDPGMTKIGANLPSAFLLRGAVSSTFTSTVASHDASWPFFRLSIEYAVKAVLTELSAERANSSGAARLVHRAKAVILRRWSDSEFGIAELTADLAVSKSTLYAAFAAAGTTPMAVIRAQRLAAAREILSHRPPARRRDFDEVAALSGFRATETLREALRANDFVRPKSSEVL
ncbi:helix-turn-helix domain-containing protein [Rathayibacter toxicus]|nr:helix-turn-helix domain-containing protein [Rathayibacter toxicus]